MAEQPESEASPPSPGTAPVKLSDCMEELLRFTLSSYLQEVPLGLSRDYCSRLLQVDQPQILNANDRGGVPSYPLYKHLAGALQRAINGEGLSRDRHLMDSVPVDGSLKEREIEWDRLVVDIGSEISNMLEGVDFELHVQEPYFSQLRDGTKTVEGRCFLGNYRKIQPGDSLLFNKCLLLRVQHVERYGSFAEMLKIETPSNTLPGVKTIEEGVQVYRNFYSEEKEISGGVIGIHVSKAASEPYISLARLLSGLSYDGIGYLLGMAHTAGTVPDALPPPRASLVESAMQLHHPNVSSEFQVEVKGCLLTNAARALAKHVNRSSEGWWGNFFGNDAEKNRLASEIINRLLDECCWMNVHLMQPHESVFEIRSNQGYGARWSADGTKFIGFLEPYMEEGYSKGWKH